MQQLTSLIGGANKDPRLWEKSPRTQQGKLRHWSLRFDTPTPSKTLVTGKSKKEPPPTDLVQSGTGESREELTCPECLRAFKSKAGLALHRRRAHPVGYHAEIVKAVKAKSKVWSSEELRVISLYEAELLLDPSNSAASGNGLNVQLSRRIQETSGEVLSAEQIKNLRRKPEYKELVTRQKIGLERADEDKITTSNTPNLNDVQMSRIATLVRSMEQGLGREPSSLEGVVPGVWTGQNLEFVDHEYSRFEQRYPAPGFKVQRTPPKFLPARRRARRKALFARVQNLYKSSRPRCAKSVLSGQWSDDQSDKVPPEELHRFWRDIFERPSAVDQRQVEPKRDVQWSLLDPIEVEEVRRCLLGIDGQTAAGPDGRKLSDIKKIPVTELSLLFNKWLYAGVLPTALWEGRTTLIPKEPGTDDPAKFRPIGVSSLLVRIYHRTLARRLDEVCPPSSRQKGFRPGDGIAENTVLLKEILRRTTDQRSLAHLYLVFLDVKKAFDSVSHQSLSLALRRAGVPANLLNYVSGLYDNGWTRTLSGGKLSSKVKPNQGVRQGDPLSSFIFNAVIDWAMEEINHDIGYDFDGDLVPYFAFADDLVILAQSKMGLAEQVSRVVRSLRSSGLEVNSKKCSTMTVVRDGKRKQWAVDKEAYLTINEGLVPALSIEDAYRYLGLQVKASGTVAAVDRRLDEHLENISRAPLKPQQRLWILRTNVYPAMTHQLVLADVTKRLLRNLDVKLRRSVRNWLRLPADTPLGFFHADVKDGGLGLPALRYDIPERITRRMTKLQLSKDPVVARVATSPGHTERLAKWSEPTYLQDKPMSAGKDLRRMSWAELLHGSVDGRGLRDHSCVPYVHSWVTDGSGLSSGHLYNAAVAVRGNLLPTRHRGSRGKSRDQQRRTCDACGPSQLETLSHISQVCPRTWGARIKRHNRLLAQLVRMLERRGYTTLAEPKFSSKRGNFKPDVLVWNVGQAAVIDVTVTTDNLPKPDSAHHAKVEKYSVVEEISEFVRKQVGVEPLYTALSINWRGALAPQSAADLRALGLTKRDLRLLSLITVEQTALIHRHFHQSTYRVRLRGQ